MKIPLRLHRFGRLVFLLFLAIALVAGLGIPGGGRAEAASRANWSRVGGLAPTDVSSIFNVKGTLYAVTGSGHVWSYDGKSWNTVRGWPDGVVSVIDLNGILYADAGGGSSVWSFDGKSWNKLSDLPHASTSMVEMNGTLYVGSHSARLMYSRDGRVWRPMKGSPKAVNSLWTVNGKLYAEHDHDTPYGGSFVHVTVTLWSYDGKGWKTIAFPPGALVAMLDMKGTIYASDGDDVLSYNGHSWKVILHNPGNSEGVTSLENVNGTLYAGAGNGVWSYNGNSWELLSHSPVVATSLLDVNGLLYAVAETGGQDPNTMNTLTDNNVYVVWSYDGRSWQSLAGGNPTGVTSLVELNGILYAHTSYGLLTYNGTFWRYAGPFYSVVNVNGTPYAVSGSGVWYYNGYTWKKKMSAPPQPDGPDPSQALLFYAKGTLYFTEGYGISSYNGKSWKTLKQPRVIPGLNAYVWWPFEMNDTFYVYGNSLWSYNGKGWNKLFTFPMTIDQSPSEAYNMTPNFVTNVVDVNGRLYAALNSKNDMYDDVWTYTGKSWEKLKAQPYPHKDLRLFDLHGTLFSIGGSSIRWYNGKSWHGNIIVPAGNDGYLPSLLDVGGILYAGGNGVWKYNGTW